ncbi:MAG: glycosyltransferase family 2 protein, partial [Blastocatellia bacterium]
MAEKRVTVAIPTRNRFEMLRRAIGSVLCQSMEDFELIVIDNASIDETQRIEEIFSDRRLSYHRNSSDIGIIENWNKAIRLANCTYVNIFHDDDYM